LNATCAPERERFARVACRIFICSSPPSVLRYLQSHDAT
jgi:hypothetical protein